ncbi:MAG: T9SS type A sorting domain-containing protein, partial [Bacteroidetes bacterium]|nr:T9SS type A sorting domain-containing protein [Bacteroidota bacterium]
KSAVISVLFCAAVSLTSRAQLCPGGGADFLSAVAFDASWIYGCNTGTSCNGGVNLSNKLACIPIPSLDICAPPPSCGNSSWNASNVWFRFYAGGTTATISCFQNSSFVIGIQAFTISGLLCSGLTELGCALAGGPSSGVQLPLTGLTPGKLYYFRIFGSASPVSQRTGIYCFCGSQGLTSALLATVTVQDFTARAGNGKNILHWKVDAGDHSSAFAIERSADGINFSPVESIEASPGQSSYSYTDASPVAGNSYYRLRQADSSGGAGYSDIIQVRQEMAKKLSFHPDAREHALFIDAPEATTVQIYDIGGRLLLSERLRAGLNRLSLDRLESGIYILRPGQSGESQKFYLPR